MVVMDKKKILEGIENCIRKQFIDPQFCVDRLIEDFNISHSYFWEMISLHYNMNPSQLIETIKLEHAIELIAKNNENLLLIGKKAGYMNPKSFRNAFKKRLQLTPVDCKQIFLNCSNIAKEIAIFKEVLWGINTEDY